MQLVQVNKPKPASRNVRFFYFDGVKPTNILLARISGDGVQHSWSIAVREPARDVWFQLGDRRDLQPESLADVKSFWNPNIFKEDDLDKWLTQIYSKLHG